MRVAHLLSPDVPGTVLVAVGTTRVSFDNTRYNPTKTHDGVLPFFSRPTHTRGGGFGVLVIGIDPV
jgi:hypothetical protein